jgi:hypothetical protein
VTGAAAHILMGAASSVGSAASAAVKKTQKVASDVKRKISFGKAKSFTNRLTGRKVEVSSVPEETYSGDLVGDEEIQQEGPMSTMVISADAGESWNSVIGEQHSNRLQTLSVDLPQVGMEATRQAFELVSPLNSHRDSEAHEPSGSEDTFHERSDLGEPQRYLITIIDAEMLTVDSGRIYFRLSIGKRRQESKKIVAGDQLIQGIIKEWTGSIKGMNEEFYFEFADPDTWILLELRHRRGNKAANDEVLGDTKLHAKVLTTTPTEEWLSLSNSAGKIRLKGMKVGRTEEIKNDGDEQVVMRAFQKHALQLQTMMHLRCRVIQALDVPAMDDTGTSDPYVVLTCGPTKKRTKVQMKTLAPKWHEDFDFFFPAGSTIPEVLR